MLTGVLCASIDSEVLNADNRNLLLKIGKIQFSHVMIHVFVEIK